MRKLLVAGILLLNLICLAYCQGRAVCVLIPTVYAPYIQGTLYLEALNADGSGGTISGTITGAPPNGVFGFHIHTYGFVGTPDGSGAGAHYNPLNVSHALPPTIPRHAGDMGNVTSDQFGTIVVNKSGTDVIWTLNGTTSVIGRALILHSKYDDGTGTTGNAGNRMAQCVIGVRNSAGNLAQADQYPWIYATAEVKGLYSYPYSTNITGRITFTTINSTAVLVKGKVCGLAPYTQHGFHVHTFGDLSGTPANANLGSHFNPASNPHALPGNPIRHEGDMGNIVSDANGVATIYMTLDLLTLSSNNSILGRAVVIHASFDDGSQPSGNSGTQYVAGIIGAINSDLAFDDVMCIVARNATCVLEAINGSGVKGVVNLAIDAYGVSTVSGTITGLTPNSVHGIHIHQYGYLTADGTGVSSHFNPLNVTHGLPGQPVRHIGDLGNSTADANGVITLNLVGPYFNLWRLDNILSVLGRGLVVHANFDDGTDPAGNSGARLAQCVIGVTNTGSLALNQAINDQPGTPYATCAIRPAQTSFGAISGRVVFYVNTVTGLVHVKAKICGLSPSTQHGFHVHEFGDFSNPTDLSANVGAHYNPYSAPHALPGKNPRHLGDMGNLAVDATGVGSYDADVDTLSLSGNTSIIGRAVVIHALVDDGTTQPSGNSGTKLATCIIGVAGQIIDNSDIICPAVSPKKSTIISPAATTYASLFVVFAAFLAMLLMLQE